MLTHREHFAPVPSGHARGGTRMERWRPMSIAKRLLIGKPIATSEEGHQRLSKRIALPVFASDAFSSSAYATD